MAHTFARPVKPAYENAHDVLSAPTRTSTRVHTHSQPATVLPKSLAGNWRCHKNPSAHSMLLTPHARMPDPIEKVAHVSTCVPTCARDDAPVLTHAPRHAHAHTHTQLWKSCALSSLTKEEEDKITESDVMEKGEKGEKSEELVMKLAKRGKGGKLR